jgi:hypothetical protein
LKDPQRDGFILSDLRLYQEGVAVYLQHKAGPYRFQFVRVRLRRANAFL